MNEFQQFTAPANTVPIDRLTKLLGALYAVPRSVAAGGKPWPSDVLKLDPKAYLVAAVKVHAAAAAGVGVAFSTAEIASYAMGQAIMATYIRHGGFLPWVADRAAEVREAIATAKDASALPDPAHGTLVLDPFGFIPSTADEVMRTTLRAARESLRALRVAPNVAPAGTFIDAPPTPIDLPPELLPVTKANPVVIAGIVGGVLVAGWGIYKWAEVAQADNAQKWFATKEVAIQMALADRGLAAATARIEAAKVNGGKVPDASATELAIADALRANAGAKSETEKYTGPIVALAFAILTGGLVWFAAKSSQKDFAG